MRRAQAAAFRIWQALPLLVASCGPIPDYRTLVEADIHPPDLLGIETRDAATIVAHFDESVAPVGGSIMIAPALTVASVHAEGCDLCVTVGEAQVIGVRYILEASVVDASGNSTTLLAPFYGYNPQVPRTLINELTTQGSGSHPDAVELFVTEPGNMAGVCLYAGMPDDWDSRIVFPSIVVVAGDYIIAHFKPSGTVEEVNETDDPSASGGLDASPVAFDEWVPESTGLSGNNGVLALYSSPGGRLLDGVLYSNRTSASDTDYGGFGSTSVFERAKALVLAGGWTIAGAQVAPEDAVSPEDSTATRSMCRDSLSNDTDSRNDWHIVPTSGITFGTQNLDEVYVPN